MITVNAYITFNGNCEEAFNFYKSVFGGDFQYIGRFKDVPPADKEKFRPENENKIMHVSLPISKESILMGCDNPIADEETVFGDNISLSVNIDNKAEADRIFNALSAGGVIKMPMSQTFWGSYFGMLCDRFEINWLINCDANASS